MFSHRFESISFWQRRRAHGRQPLGEGYGWSGRLPLVLALGLALLAVLVLGGMPLATGTAAKSLAPEPNIKPVEYNIQAAPAEIKPVEYNIQAAPAEIKPVDYNIQVAPDHIQPIDYNIQVAPEHIQPIDYNIQLAPDGTPLTQPLLTQPL